MEDWSTGGVCLDCPENSHTTTVGSTNSQQCICDEGYSGPNGGPCQGKHSDIVTRCAVDEYLLRFIVVALLVITVYQDLILFFKRCCVFYQTFQFMGLAQPVS